MDSTLATLPSPPVQWYGDTPERAGEYVRIVLPLLAAHRLPANPVNFGVFYDYASGRTRGLADELDALLAAGVPITGEVTQQLFLRYVCPCDAQLVERLRLDLRRIVDDAIECVATTGTGTTRSRATLEAHARVLAREVAPPALAQLVTAIVQETENMARVEQGLEKHLATAATEIQGLREELERARQEATTDALTEIPNRRAFDAALDEAVRLAGTNGHDLCLALVDIDHFKRVNDSYGHLIGDKVLRLIAAKLKDCVKGRDLVARYGGEEFAVILPDTPPQGGRALAESIRVTIEQARVKRADTGEPLGQITVSVGVAHFRPGDAADNLTSRCDAALYQAKNAGRNRVVLAA